MTAQVDEIAAPVAEAQWRAHKAWNVWHNTGGWAGQPSRAEERLAEETLYAQLKADRAQIPLDALTVAVKMIYDRLQAESFADMVKSIQEYKAHRRLSETDKPVPDGGT